MKKSELKNLIKEVISEDIFLQNKKSPEEKAKTLDQELDLEYKSKFGVEVYEGDLILTKQTLPYFKKYSKIKKIIGTFYCINLELKSLTKLPIPEKIEGNFICSLNYLTSLEGAPKIMNGDFDCSHNKLTTLDGVSKEVGGSFWCNDNDLTSLKGAPKVVGKGFICHNNSAKFTEEDVRKFCDVKGKIYC